MEREPVLWAILRHCGSLLKTFVLQRCLDRPEFLWTFNTENTMSLRSKSEGLREI